MKMLIREDELEHYGVKGMKWGIRRYQPYTDGKKGVYLGDPVGARKLKYKSPLVSTVANSAARGVVYGLASLIPGGVTLMNAYTLKQVAKYNWDSRNYVKKDGEFEKLKDLKKKTSKTTPEEDAKQVNPGSGAGKVNNCMNCTATYEMRRRGYDVQARRSGKGMSTGKYSEWFENVQYNQVTGNRKPGESRKYWVTKTYEALTREIEKLPEGARGFCAFQYENMRNGHTVSWEIKDGSVIFYDGQSGNTKTDTVFSFSNQNYTWARLDNLKIKPGITDACVSKKSR